MRKKKKKRSPDTQPERVRVSGKVGVGNYFDAGINVEGEGRTIASKALYVGGMLVALIVGAAIYLFG